MLVNKILKVRKKTLHQLFFLQRSINASHAIHRQTMNSGEELLSEQKNRFII
jgi:hypothetical protein